MIVHLQVLAAILTIAVIFSLVLSATESQLGLLKAATKTAPLYGLPLAQSIFLVMWERGSNPEKILGYRSQSEQSVFSAFLQNTLEQTMMAILALATFVTYAPVKFAPLITASGWIYIVGRFLFLIGYLASPMWRFYGFSLNFYTSVALLLIGIWNIAYGA